MGLVKSRSFRCFLGELQMVTTTITRGTFHAHIFSSSFRCVFRPFFREILSLDHGIDLVQTKNVRHHQCDAALSLYVLIRDHSPKSDSISIGRVFFGGSGAPESAPAVGQGV